MKKRLTLPLKVKLVLLSIIPLAAFITFGVLTMRTSLQDLAVIEKMHLNADFIVRNADYINALQRERLLSESYIAGRIPYSEVADAVRETDARAEDFSAALERSELPAAIKYVGKSVSGNLETLRKEIKNKQTFGSISVSAVSPFP